MDFTVSATSQPALRWQISSRFLKLEIFRSFEGGKPRASSAAMLKRFVYVLRNDETPARYYPRQLATFRKIVVARTESLRSLTFAELKSMAKAQAEDLTVDCRRPTINTIVEPVEADRLRVVVHGHRAASKYSGVNYT